MMRATDTRTSQIASDLLYLRDRVPSLEERIDYGLRVLKSGLGLTFSTICERSARRRSAATGCWMT
ncbi:MAG TPA: hypothetical protein VFO07_02310 [Roseiflexaceae bacterium]|nr:hypothetical protein [Roseiflexaceae bacterium]